MRKQCLKNVNNLIISISISLKQFQYESQNN